MAIMGTLNKLDGKALPAIDRDPPKGQFAAYVLSTSKLWIQFWRTSTIFQRVQEIQQCPDNDTKILIIHGTEDDKVPLQSSKDLVRELGKWALDIQLCEVVGESHAFDYSRDMPKVGKTLDQFVENR